MSKEGYDIQSDNFDFFFESQLATMSQSQKELVPDNLLHKVVPVNGFVNERFARKLTFFQKMFVLFKALNKRVIIIVEDEEKGMTEEDYFAFKKKMKKHDFGTSITGNFITQASFILGNKELCETYHRLNLLSGGSAYGYLVQAKNKNNTKPAQWITAINYINRFLTHYEANRKKITLNTGITISEWLVLVHLYHGNLVPSSTIYKEWYKASFNSSATNIKTAFSSLRQRGYVEKVGVSKAAKIKITALGRDKVNEILKKYVLNC